MSERRMEIELIRERIWALETERRDLEKKFSELILAEEGVISGDVLEEQELGTQYVVIRATAACQPFSKSEKNIHLVCRRLFKSGRRAGRQAHSETYIWLTERFRKIGTLQSDGTVLSVEASEAGAST